MKLNKEQVMDFLPHRDPFLFVDSVEKIIYPDGLDESSANDFKQMIGGKVIVHFAVKDDLKILEGHFPGNPILPGVVQVEMMAQASTFINYDIVVNYGKTNEIEMDVALLGCDYSRFRKPIKPGMKLVIESECTKVRGPFVGYKCKISHNNELVSEADILASYKYKK